MKFAMITTFFGKHSFGGDAAYVDRLARMLLKRGHSVDVFYSSSSFKLLSKGHPGRTYHPPDILRIFPLQGRFGALNLLLIHQTGSPCLLKPQLSDILRQNKYDVIHFHNISLIGGPGLFGIKTGNRQTIKIMTAHEHWLMCPLSLLWQYDKQVCEKKKCIRCAIKSGRPPQLWRNLSPPLNKLKQLDALICPSIHTRKLHAEHFDNVPVFRLPYCLPEDWPESSDNAKEHFSTWMRPYFAAAGRLVKEKGFQNLIRVMRHFPDYDLLIAGIGPFEKELVKLANSSSNVHFIGLLDEKKMPALFQSAIAVIMPSLFYETFGYVALEALSVRTPVILNDIGALPELIEVSGAGFIYKTEAQLIDAMRKLAEDRDLRNRLGEKGWLAWRQNWSEEMHLDMYYHLLEQFL